MSQLSTTSTFMLSWPFISSALLSQHDDGARAHRVVRSFQPGFVFRFNDVFRTRPCRVHNPPPLRESTLLHREGVVFPVPVDHDVEIVISDRRAAEVIGKTPRFMP